MELRTTSTAVEAKTTSYSYRASVLSELERLLLSGPHSPKIREIWCTLHPDSGIPVDMRVVPT